MNQGRLFRVGGVPEHFNLPWHLAIENNVLAGENLRLQFINFTGGTGQILKALGDREIEIALVLTESCFAYQLYNPNVRMVKVYVETPLIWGIHVAAKSRLMKVDEIRGCRFAVSRFGSGSHLMALVDHQMRNWPIEMIRLVEVGGLEAARKSLAKGESDVFLWERYTTSQLVQSNEFRRLDDRKAPWPAFVAAVHVDTIDSSGSALKVILARIQQLANQWLQAPHDAASHVAASHVAADLIASRYQLELAQVKQWLQQTEWSRDFEIPWGGLEAVWNIFQQIGMDGLRSNPANPVNPAGPDTPDFSAIASSEKQFIRQFIRQSIWHQL